MDLQEMDKHHRIGQTKPVHVYRQTTAHSIEGQMLKRAFGKLKQEHNLFERLVELLITDCASTFPRA